MEAFTLGLGRCWILRAFGSNPVVRLSDRIEAAGAIIVLVLVLVVTAVSGGVGTAVHDSRARLYTEESMTRHTVQAAVLRDSTAVVHRTHTDFRAPLRWQARDGLRVATTPLDHAANAGDRVLVWVDAAGNQTPPPTSTWQAGYDAVGTALAVWAIMVAIIVIASGLVRRALTHRRHLGWDREWRALVNEDGGLTGRQS